MKKFLIIIAILIAGAFLIDSLPALAQGSTALGGLDETAEVAGYSTGSDANLTTVVGNIIKAILGVLGIVFALLLIYGGIQYMTAHGNEENVKKAKDTLIAAVVGIIIIVASYAVASFVIFQLTLIEGDTAYQRTIDEICQQDSTDPICIGR